MLTRCNKMEVKRAKQLKRPVSAVTDYWCLSLKLLRRPAFSRNNIDYGCQPSFRLSAERWTATADQINISAWFAFAHGSRLMNHDNKALLIGRLIN